MRKFILSVAFIGFALICFSQGTIDVLRYKFIIDLNDNNDSIYGLSVITFKSNTDISSVDFDLTDVKAGKGMTVTKVSLTETNSPIPFTHKGEKLTINAQVRKDDSLNLFVYYKGIPADGLIISKNKYGNRTFFADNWPNRGHNWLPCHDDPADKAAVEFVVTAPQHYQVVANGIQIEETNLAGNQPAGQAGKKRTHWREDVPISTKVMVIGVADFAVNLSGVIDGCIPVYSWVYPENIGNGFYDYAQAAEILPWFIKNVGPYGYKKLANVQSKTIFGGLENANTIFYSESSVTGTRKSESLLAHEIAHQWFGNMATEKTFAHLWLSEGFATYMTILYMENKYGADTARKMLLEDREQVIGFAKQSNRPVVDNTTDYMELLNPNSYQKGGWILHMLRKQLGDVAFWNSIREYYKTFSGKTADTDDLRKLFEKNSGKDLKQFFQQWLYTPGIPELIINWKYLAKEKKVTVTIEQKQASVFQFPLELSINTAKGKSVQSLTISKQKETFTFAVLSGVQAVKVDPNNALLYTASISQEK